MKKKDPTITAVLNLILPGVPSKKSIVTPKRIRSALNDFLLGHVTMDPPPTARFVH